VFTGIVEEIGRVASAPGGTLAITAKDVLPGMKLGGSIAVNGACLTVTDFTSNSFSVDVMPETLSRTNLGLLHAGDTINLERPMALGGELGGHLVQGHVDDTGRVTSITWDGDATIIRFETSPETLSFTVLKGFITVDGVSLTIVAKDSSSFSVSVVGYTRQHTTLGSKQVGDLINLEIDIIAKYVAQFNQPPRTAITAEFLEEHGFSLS